MKTTKSLVLILGILFLFSCKNTEKEKTVNTSIVYFGGDIIKMSGDTPEYAEALVINEGKLADLVILDQNPLKVDPMTIKEIKVLETIKEGVTVFKK